VLVTDCIHAEEVRRLSSPLLAVAAIVGTIFPRTCYDTVASDAVLVRSENMWVLHFSFIVVRSRHSPLYCTYPATVLIDNANQTVINHYHRGKVRSQSL
jgi:hypothetical protein